MKAKGWSIFAFGILYALSVWLVTQAGSSDTASPGGQRPASAVEVLSSFRIGSAAPFTTTTSTPTTPVPSPTCCGSPTAVSTPPPSVTPIPTPTLAICKIKFSDVPPGSPFYRYVYCMACLGIVTGYNDGDFHPNALTTRVQITKIIVFTANYIDPNDWQLIDPPDNTFEDVPYGDTFYQYVETAYAHSIISGYPCGVPPAGPCVPPGNKPYFLPYSNATRGQIAKIDAEVAMQIMGWSLDNPPSGTFQDVPPGSAFYRYVETLYAHGVVGGYPCGAPPAGPCIPPGKPYFLPGNNTTRGQAVKIISLTFFPNCEAHSRR